MKRFALVLLARSVVASWVFMTAGLPGQRAYGEEPSFKVMAANLSGENGVYGERAHRIFEGLKPDIVAVQEWVLPKESHREFVDRTLGADFHYYVELESSDGIPNGIISRWPILASGEWRDPIVLNRDFAWATIDLPGPRNLHVVSVHLKSGEETYAKLGRWRQAETLIRCIRRAKWSPSDYLVIAGDFNVVGRNEKAMRLLGQLVSTAREPVDQNGDKTTNIPRTQTYDYVLPNPEMEKQQVPLLVDRSAFPDGMVFDSRVWATPPAPIQSGDSSAEGMQHLAVIKAFLLPSD